MSVRVMARVIGLGLDFIFVFELVFFLILVFDLGFDLSFVFV